MEFGLNKSDRSEAAPLLSDGERQETYLSESNEMKAAVAVNSTLSLNAQLQRRNLPTSLKRRLLKDSESGGQHYKRLNAVTDIQCKKANSSYAGAAVSCLTCATSELVQKGFLGRYRENDEFHFLAPGYHKYSSFGNELMEQISVQRVDQPISNGTMGFITITEKCLGVMVVGGEYKLLAPGVYQWFTAAVTEVKAVDITKDQCCNLGPYSLLTAEVGDAAVTYNHGTLRVLGHDESNAYVRQTSEDYKERSDSHHQEHNGSRTFFLDDPRWRFSNFLSLRRQTDRLEGNDLLSRDNVEVLLVAMAQWRIVDAQLCATQCSAAMKDVRKKVDDLVRATIARIVAASALGQGGGSNANAGHVGVEVNSAVGHAEDDDGTLAHVMLSKDAIQHMSELKATMNRLGIEVFGVYIPEKRIKSDETRRAVASQAVIGIQAEQQRSSADAEAYATTVAARAEAESIRLVSEAHQGAGERLGSSKGTGAKLALAQQTGKALKTGTTITIFSEKPSDLPYLFAPEDKYRRITLNGTIIFGIYMVGTKIMWDGVLGNHDHRMVFSHGTVQNSLEFVHLLSFSPSTLRSLSSMFPRQQLAKKSRIRVPRTSHELLPELQPGPEHG